jgi:hypothetical protein
MTGTGRMRRTAAFRNGFVAELRHGLASRCLGGSFQGLKVRTSYSTTPGTDFFTVRQLQPNRAIVLFWDSHLRFVVPRHLRDNQGTVVSMGNSVGCQLSRKKTREILG